MSALCALPVIPPPAGVVMAILARRPALNALPANLPTDEWARATAIASDATRARFVQGRILLRAVLGRMLGCVSSDVPLDLPPSGKPRLASGEPDLRFSLSVGETLALVAVATGRDVGADVEEAAPPDAEAVAHVIMSETERAAFHGLPPADRPAEFLRCWRRKEAVLKGAGLGFSLDPRLLHVGIGGNAGIGHVPGAGPFAWADVPDAPAAVAVAGESVTLEVIRV